MDELEKYYQYLKSAGADVPDNFDSFRSTLQDPASSQKYYQYLRENKFDAPDTYDSFANTLGLKKKESGISTSVPQSTSNVPNKTPDFGLPSFRQMQQENVAPSESTVVVQPKQALAHQEYLTEKPQIEAEKKRIREEAINNGIQDYFKNKGINAPVGSALYNEQKQNVEAAIANGLVTPGRNKVTGEPGLYRNTGFLDNLISGFKKSNQQANDDADFVNNMTPQQQVDYIEKNQEEQHIPGFIGDRPEGLTGGVGKVLGGGVRYMGNAAIGAGIGSLAIAGAPETMGASLAGLPIASSFLLTAPDMINANAADAVKEEYLKLRHDNPNMPKLQAMEEANKAKWRGGLTGLGTAAAFSGLGTGEALTPTSKGVIEDAVDHVIKPAIHVGAVTGVAKGVEQEIGNLQGQHTDQADILKNAVSTGLENAGATIALNGILHYVPKMLNSAFKYSIVKDVPPSNVESFLQANVEAGKITPEIAQKTIQDLHDYGDALKETPSGLTPESEASYAGLVAAKKNLQKEMATKDVNAQPIYQTKIDAIDGQLQKIIQTNKPADVEVDELTGKTYQQQTGQANEEAQKENQVPQPETQTSPTNEGANQTEQPTEKERQNNADLMRDILDETSTSKDANVLTFKEKDNIDSGINDYESGKITGEELKNIFIKNHVPEEYLSRKMVENGMNKNFELPSSEQQPVPSKEPIAEPKDINTTDYRGEHQIVTPLTTADNLEGGGSGFEWKFSAQDWEGQHYKESLAKLKSIKDKPDAEVTIYRAVPKGVKDINEGDWISLSKTYAKEHGMHETDASKDMPVISKKVKAKDIGWDGNDLNEFVYNPKKAEQQLSKEPIIEPTNKEENKPVDNEQHRGKLMDMLYNMKDSKFGERIDALISQKEREKGVDDLKSGKDSAAARKVKDLLDNIIKEGTIPFIRGRGGQTERFDIPMKDWFTEPLDEKELNAAENLDDFTASIINDEGINIKNIDNLKHLFNGFPYTEEDFNKIKSYLSRESESNTNTKNAPKESGSEKVKEEIPIEEKPTKENIPPTEPPKEEKKSEASEENYTSIKNAIVDKEREKRGLPPAYQEAKKEFGKTWDNAMESLDKNPDAGVELVNELKKKPKPLSDEENAILLHRQVDLQNQYDKVNSEINKAFEAKDDVEGNRLKLRLAALSDALQDVYDVGKRSGVENARGLNSRKMLAKEDFTLAAMETQKRAANGGRPLTDEERSHLTELSKRIKELEDRVKELEEKNALPKVPKNKYKKSDKDYAAEREKILQNIRDKLKKSRGSTQATIVPYAKELFDIAPDVAKLVKSLVEQGYTKLEDVVDHVYNNLKHAIPELKKEDAKDLVTGKYNSPKQPRILTPEETKAKAELERHKIQFRMELEKDRIANATKLEKGMAGFVRWERAFKLSSPITIAKLTMAALYRAAYTPPEEAVGGIVTKLLPKKLTEGAYSEAGLNVKAEAKAITKMFTEGVRDAVATVKLKKGGRSDLEVLYGKQGALPPEVADFFGHIHGALKAPIKRAAFERSMVKQNANMIKAGIDVSDPLVQTSIAMRAYQDAKRAIFMQDNQAADWWQRHMVGHPTSLTGKTRAAFAQFLVPFVKIPTNIVGETFTYSTGVLQGAAKLSYAMSKGLENVAPEEKDAIVRCFKKGAVGAGFLLLGYYNPNAIGGYYTGKRSDEDVAVGGIKIFGKEMPNWLLHNPLMEQLQIGATVRRVADSYIGNTEEKQGLATGIGESLLGLTKEVPFVNEAGQLNKFVGNKYDRENFLDEMAKNTLEPAALQAIAKYTDADVKRRPETLIEHLKMGIPGLRQEVSAKRSYTKEDLQQPEFRYFTDKGMSLPYTSERNISIKDYRNGQIKKLSDYPDKVKDEYYDTRKEILRKELGDIERKGYVYVDKFGSVSFNYESGHKRTRIDVLTRPQMAQVLSIASRNAATKTKQKVFKEESKMW